MSVSGLLPAEALAGPHQMHLEESWTWADPSSFLLSLHWASQPAQEEMNLKRGSLPTVGSAAQRLRVEKTGQREMPGELADALLSSGCRKEHLVTRSKSHCQDLRRDSWLFSFLLFLGPLTSVFRPVNTLMRLFSLLSGSRPPRAMAGGHKWGADRSRCGAKLPTCYLLLVTCYCLLVTGSDQQLDLSKPRFPHLLRGIRGNSHRNVFKGIVIQKLSVWLGI